MCGKQGGCQKPQDLEGKPQDCSPEQIKKCHGDVEAHPCAATAGCEHPEKLKGKPGECSPEQVRECHGDAGEHPCVPQ